MPDDFIGAVRTAAIANGLDVAAADKMERELRREWGGERVYLAKAPVTVKIRALAARLVAGEAPATAIRRAGLASSTGYRLLSRRWSR